MKFAQYLRTCRERLGLTQDELVSELYLFDESFEGVDASTLSKWEREVILPRLSRQVGILRFFQERTGLALPCWDGMDRESSERAICQRGVRNLLGRSRKIILGFPLSLPMDEVTVVQLRDAKQIEVYIGMARGLDREFTQDYSALQPEHFRRWALHPSHAFYVAEYKQQFMGLLFALKVRKEIFDKLLEFGIEECELDESAFPTIEEPGCSYLLNFFALNDEVASMLFLRYYAHLITHQKQISDVGLIVALEDARKLIKDMNLLPYRTRRVSSTLELQSYRNTLPGFFTAPKVLQMFFDPSDCPEE